MEPLDSPMRLMKPVWTRYLVTTYFLASLHIPFADDRRYGPRIATWCDVIATV
ncbi:uncharacterized protein BO88DRAFT_405876 [Aspergillus vadensis CBS 113365]|uniref:Uncharacterized protein n=1 Tax=Aspergillus vadensis (strain CBS 113365 / IMI 142717 / IBT 24658) TaxID=1448311 RepID=A0A319B648_ASPVC|nr:hypothetical protein BO88DRAFT_405876 [Aspergillus vadensis CBS 113365]PYH67925.1 hypothetical protein BO88DRAFT_405876 [Aspergillus vadensis CBS 113365]